MLTLLSSAIVLGLVAGLSPGPMLTLVISQTINYNFREGVKVAFSPLLTDIPIIMVCIFVLSYIENYNIALGIISLLGALFIFYLSWDCFSQNPNIQIPKTFKAKSIQKGVIANILNPHPWVFWFTIGSTTLLKAYKMYSLLPIVYLLIFYICLIGSKISIAVLFSKSKKILNPKIIKIINRILALMLLFFASMFFIESYRLLLVSYQ